MNEGIETALAEGGIVPGKADGRFGFALRAVHGINKKPNKPYEPFSAA
jgi:hypothetical protein